MKKTVMMLVPTLLSLMLCACGSNSENPTTNSDSNSIPASTEKEKTTLLAPTNFRIDRTEGGKWIAHFDAVENATTYELTGYLDNTSFLSDANVKNDYTFEAGEQVGVYDFRLKAKGNSELYNPSIEATYSIKVALYNNTEIEGVTYTGRVENDIPVGNYHLVYSDGTTFDGIVTEEYKRAKGKLQYTNKMYYEGEFINDNFEGDGMFTWSMTGDYKEGNTYQGKFKGGNYNDQVGTYTTAANFTRPIAYNGILNFTGTMGPVFGAPGKAGTVGKGEFSYGNNSIYSGDLLKGNGDWEFYRQGWGKNTWTVTEAAGWISGGNTSYTIDNFEGEFDSTNHAWIYGNGIWYFKKDGAPYGYIKGKWDGGNRIGESDIELTIQDAYKDVLDLTPKA